MVPAVIAALFGSSWHLVSGPTNAVSLVVFATLSGLAEPGSGALHRVGAVPHADDRRAATRARLGPPRQPRQPDLAQRRHRFHGRGGDPHHYLAASQLFRHRHPARRRFLRDDCPARSAGGRDQPVRHGGRRSHARCRHRGAAVLAARAVHGRRAGRRQPPGTSTEPRARRCRDRHHHGRRIARRAAATVAARSVAAARDRACGVCRHPCSG